MSLRLNLGCGPHHRPEGYWHVDREATAYPDQMADLEEFWPWGDGSVDEILMNHVMEHLPDHRHIYKESYRVLRAGGLLQINVPHHLSEGYYGDPTHVKPVTLQMLSCLSRRLNRMTIEKGWANSPLGIYWEVDFEVEKVDLTLTPDFKDKGLSQESLEFAMKHMFDVVDEVKFTLRKV